MAATIRDVARLAGVSHQTVSRIINNSCNVSPDTLSRVKDAIEKLNYHPNVSARNLQKKIVDAIGFVCPMDSEMMKTNYFYTSVLSVMNKICFEKNIRLYVIPVHFAEFSAEPILRAYHQRAISGVLLSSPTQDAQALIDLKAARVPFTIIGRPAIQLETYVDNNNRLLLVDAMSRLVDLGHRQIGFINGPEYMTMCQDHLSGYEDAVLKYSLPFNPEYIVNTELHEPAAREASLKLLKQHPEITAVICVDELCAVGAINAAKSLNLSIPEAISVLALSYQPWSTFIDPQITCYERNSDLMCARATNMLLDIIYNNTFTSKEIVPFTYIEGKSIAPPASI